jgi:hypothetical protein
MKTMNQVTNRIEQFKNENEKKFFLIIAILSIALWINVFG